MIAPLGPRTVHSDLLTLHYDDDFEPIPAAERTAARPGSPGKIKVMRLRAERGECLYHRDDDRRVLPVRDTSTGYQAGIREVAAIG